MNSTARFKWLIGTLAALGISITAAFTYSGAEPVSSERPGPRARKTAVENETTDRRPPPPAARAKTETTRRDRKPSVRNTPQGRKQRGVRTPEIKHRKADPMG